jgi:ABC-type lipoprotein release transport system permease subunit
MLFGLKPTDPASMILAVGGLTIVAIAASLLPAVRATAVDPTHVLREE